MKTIVLTDTAVRLLLQDMLVARNWQDHLSRQTYHPSYESVEDGQDAARTRRDVYQGIIDQLEDQPLRHMWRNSFERKRHWRCLRCGETREQLVQPNDMTCGGAG